MKADRFYTVQIVDKCSRMCMLLFAGILLGAVIALFFHNVLCPKIDITVLVMAIYCVAFSAYVYIANLKRKISRLQIFKDRLVFTFLQKHLISTQKEVYFDEIKSYTVSPLTDKKNAQKETPDINKYNLRVFGYKTVVELHSGEVIEFQDTYSDGVLIYSPSYAYRLIDIKRYKPDFPLNLINFESKNDDEDFLLQFKHYEETANGLSLFKNKKYLKCLLKYTATFVVITLVIALSMTYYIKSCLYNIKDYFILYTAIAGILLVVLLSMWLTAYLSAVIGDKLNARVRGLIKSVLTEEN